MTGKLNYKTSTVVPKRDMNNDNSIGHANTDGENLTKPYTYMKSYHQSMTDS